MPDAQEFLDRKLKQDSHFAQKLEVEKLIFSELTNILWIHFQQCRQKAGELGKFQLRDTVVLPFQRIVKYSLLLHVRHIFSGFFSYWIYPNDHIQSIEFFLFFYLDNEEKRPIHWSQWWCQTKTPRKSRTINDCNQLTKTTTIAIHTFVYFRMLISI